MNIQEATDAARKTFDDFIEHLKNTVSQFDEQYFNEVMTTQIDAIIDLTDQAHDYFTHLDAEDIANLSAASVLLGTGMIVAGYSMEHAASVHLLIESKAHLTAYSHGITNQIKNIYAHGGNTIDVGLAILKGDIMTHGGKAAISGAGLMIGGITAFFANAAAEYIRTHETEVPYKKQHRVGVGPYRDYATTAFKLSDNQADELPLRRAPTESPRSFRDYATPEVLARENKFPIKPAIQPPINVAAIATLSRRRKPAGDIDLYDGPRAS